MRKCAEPRPAGDHWITTIHCCVTDLHAGAHSVEVYEKKAGGRSLRCEHRGFFGGESMFIAARCSRLRSYILCSTCAAGSFCSMARCRRPSGGPGAAEIPLTSSSHDCNRLLPFRSRSDRATRDGRLSSPSCPAAECCPRVGSPSASPAAPSGGFGEAERSERGGVACGAKAEHPLRVPYQCVVACAARGTRCLRQADR